MDGSKDDGRHPVATAALDLQRSLARAATALGEKSPSQARMPLEDPFINAGDGPGSPRPSSPQEAPDSPRSELEGARARLRPVISRGQDTSRRSEDMSSTLAELGFMIDTALDEHRSDDSPGVSPANLSRNPSVRSHRTANAQSVDRPHMQGRLFTRYRSHGTAKQ